MKWKTLQHNGILFPPDFESQGIKIRIKGQPMPAKIISLGDVFTNNDESDIFVKTSVRLN